MKWSPLQSADSLLFTFWKDGANRMSYFSNAQVETDEVSASLDHSISMILDECFSSTIFNEA